MRARNIKQGFFENEILAELSPLTRILYAGLWCYADREGRFEWRPKRIKACLLPYDDCDIDEMLMSLNAMSFIYTYMIGNDTYGFIPKFKDHQHPHPNEAKSKIPAPIENIEEYQCDEITLNDITFPEKELRLQADIRNEDIRNEDIRNEDTAAEKQSACPHLEIVKLFNEILSPSLAAVKPTLWNGTRKKSLSARWKEDPDRQQIEWWEDYFHSVTSMSFLMGENDRGWTADMGWLLKPDNMVKVLEGKYKKSGNQQSPVPCPTARQAQLQNTMIMIKAIKERENAARIDAGAECSGQALIALP